ncbi:MAG: hypothetical protein R3F54_23155 [Alphaproteobacteria bacterium]
MASLEATRAAWDKIAQGYDKTNTPTQMWLGKEWLSVPASARACVFWTLHPAAARSAFLQLGWARQSWQPTSRP